MQTDVIIIGAGSAGLSAAKELTKQGISFIVVEASHRIGGRAYSEEIASDVWFDLGCAYLDAGPDAKNHIDESNPFVDFAKNQGAVIDEYDFEAHYNYNGRPLDENEIKAREQYYKECEEAIRSSVDGGDDCAISEIVDLENPYATPYIDMMAVTAPKDLDEASAADFFHKVEEYVSFNILRGYGNLVAQHIHFKPRLPDWKMEAIQGVPMGAAWVTDPWTLGSYACALPGQFHQRESLPLAIDNKLFFAGEATARANGTCHGAYWSGIRAAREVAKVLN